MDWAQAGIKRLQLNKSTESVRESMDKIDRNLGEDILILIPFGSLQSIYDMLDLHKAQETQRSRLFLLAGSFATVDQHDVRRAYSLVARHAKVSYFPIS
jgi:hypothetical protein